MKYTLEITQLRHNRTVIPDPEKPWEQHREDIPGESYYRLLVKDVEKDVIRAHESVAFRDDDLAAATEARNAAVLAALASITRRLKLEAEAELATA